MASLNIVAVSWTDADYTPATTASTVNLYLAVTVGTVLTVPSTVQVKVRLGDGATTTATLAGATVLQDAPGLYHYPLAIGAAQAGEASYTWTTTAPAATSSGKFTAYKVAVP